MNQVQMLKSGLKMLLYPERRSKIFFVGLTHSVLTCYGLLMTIFDIINEQNPFSVYELAIVLVHYLGHSLLIYLLFLGFKYNLPLLYLPWLSIFLGVFATVSFLWLESLAKAASLKVLPFFGNLVVLGLCWLSWTTVLKDFLLIAFSPKIKIVSKIYNF
ncbi:uncharacterized protein LOC126749498 [Anthonomus grandis grandis]|uniref:uncharacterized protein LOC126749498 n=1 Tax=Anthonomus grandis grandis TaxID=2921223 RepID=UPI0021655746|nr:uncharacterized protein LOC126749498 [Anthonomus grandis grandis]